MSTRRASSVLIVDADNNLLVVRRGETHPYAAYEPDLPGGLIEENETHRDGLAREIVEEVALVIPAEDLEEISIIQHKDFFRVNTIEHSMYAYRFGTRPEIILSWEHDQFQWIPITDVKGLEAPVQRELERIITDGFFNTF